MQNEYFDLVAIQQGVLVTLEVVAVKDPSSFLKKLNAFPRPLHFVGGTVGAIDKLMLVPHIDLSRD